jgi:hypothetical protein
MAEHDQPVETDVEGEIREFVRRDVVANPGRQTDNEPQLEASNINSVLQRASATSVREIDKLITELQVLRDRLHSEAARVQREIVQYSNLTEAALQSTKTKRGHAMRCLDNQGKIAWKATPRFLTMLADAEREAEADLQHHP